MGASFGTPIFFIIIIIIIYNWIILIEHVQNFSMT